jgi:hypothetical protein
LSPRKRKQQEAGENCVMSFITFIPLLLIIGLIKSSMRKRAGCVTCEGEERRKMTYWGLIGRQGKIHLEDLGIDEIL